MIDFNNIKNALYPFQEDLDLDNEQRYHWLKEDILLGRINIEMLKADFSNYNINWIELAKQTTLLINVELYTNEEILNYIKSWLWDYLYPEKIVSNEKIELLNSTVQNILKAYVLNDGWMYSYDLFEELKKEEPFKDLEYCNLWKISFDKLNIEIKPIENKDIEIGYLRYKETAGLKE